MPIYARWILIAGLAAGLWPPPVMAAEPVPHRAIYDIVLTAAKSGSHIAAVRGEMLADWSESCEGWALDHRSLFDITYEEGGTVRITSTVATWESRDGLEYRFNVRNAADGKETERYEGRARLTGEGGRGTVDYAVPQRDPLRLEPGTVFPMTHTVRVLAATDTAPTILSMVVFDGMSEEGVFQVSAVIGKPTADVARSKAAAKLKGLRAWPLQLAYFAHGGREAEPEHEVGMRIYDNGVSDRMFLDFGDFKVQAELVRLELGSRPSCGA